MICDQCGEDKATTRLRENNYTECDRCWRSSLDHGHLHGLHVDEDHEPAYLKDCPSCPRDPVRYAVEYAVAMATGPHAVFALAVANAIVEEMRRDLLRRLERERDSQ